MAVNTKTRLPPMCPGKKILGRLCQKMRSRYKLVLQSMLLKDSLCREPVRSWVDNLQKEDFLLSNTTVFLHSQTDQHKAAAPRSTSGLYSLGILLSLLPHILGILWGFGMPQAALTEAHTILVNRQ